MPYRYTYFLTRDFENEKRSRDICARLLKVIGTTAVELIKNNHEHIEIKVSTAESYSSATDIMFDKIVHARGV